MSADKPYDLEKDRALMNSALTPDERAKRQAAAESEAEFQRDERARAERDASAAKERKRIQSEAAAPKVPGKVFFMLVAKKTDPANKKPVFRVVGIYSDRPGLAAAMIEASEKYIMAAQPLGIVEFDAGVVVDALPGDPS